MRIIIAGSRSFDDYELLVSECNRIFKQLSDEGLLTGKIDLNIPDMEIISGKARGADTLGEEFAKDYGIKIKQFVPDWDGLGKRAGYVRNADMALYAKEDNGVLIAFYDGESKGTKHMIDLAKKHGLKVFVVNF